MNRRDFLARSGGLVVGVAAGGRLAARAGGGLSAQEFTGRSRAGDPDASRLDAWLGIGADGRVTARTGKCELGQGLHTAQVQLIAEELSVGVDRVTLIQCDTGTTPDQGTTSGSQSHPTNFNGRGLAQACATARAALVGLASARLGVPPDRLTAVNGAVHVVGDASRSLTYAELLKDSRLDLPIDPRARRKPHRDWTVLGASVPRLDLPALATGTFEFVHNVHVDGMVHGRVVRPPGLGATLQAIDEASVRSLPGFVAVVRKANFLGVVCDKPWQAALAARALKAVWTPGPRLPDQATFYDWMRRQPSRDARLVDSGDVDAALDTAARRLDATYLHPYQAHGAMGASCAVADVRDGRATLWSATQSAYPVRDTAAMVLGLRPAQVRVIYTRGSGCYGLTGADTVTYDAALMSQAVGRPVKVQLSRADEAGWENFGYAYVIDLRAGLDAQGRIVAWDCESWNPVRGGRPGYQTPGNVITGHLLGFPAAAFAPRSPAPAPAAFANGSNAVPSYFRGAVGGAAQGTGTIAGERVVTHAVASPFFTGPLRSPSRLQNTFAHESFMDELAAAAGADPVRFRLAHLRDPRLVDVLNAAARAAGWQERPSPRRDRPASGLARGRGVSCVLYEGDNGYCALVAEVEVDQATGRVRVTRLVSSQDCGPISSPDGMRNQIEGGALQGLSRAMGEAVTWDDARVTSVDWRSYRSLSLGAEVPAVESVLLDRPDHEAMGAGETTITLIAAAVGNAVFDATGARLREVPFTAARVAAALAAREP
jgi:nicotinate dehydrogenase subunit B